MSLLEIRSETLTVIEHLMAGGELLPSQAPAPSRWCGERGLMAAILALALVEVRDHHADPKYKRSIEKDLEWIFSDDGNWPGSFIPLCPSVDKGSHGPKGHATKGQYPGPAGSNRRRIATAEGRLMSQLLSRLDPRSETPTMIDYLMAGGELLPSQAPAPSQWSAERGLMAAVLAVALVEVRDHHADPKYKRAVDKDLEWIFSDDDDWPCSFVPLCQLCGLSPEYVRGVVTRWVGEGEQVERRPYFVHRRAA
jgi:hypothetical protein